MRLFFVLAVVLVPLAVNADPEIYKWVDEEGNVHYSDCPPPPECEPEVMEEMPGPAEEDVRRARQRLDAMLFEQEESRALRERERLQRERQRVEAMRVAVERKRRCIFAQQNLHQLLMNRPVYHLDETGKRVYLDDKAHKEAISRMQQLIRDNCARE